MGNKLFKNRLITLCAPLFLAAAMMTTTASAATFNITLAEIQAEVGVIATFKDASASNGLCDQMARSLEYDGSSTKFKVTEIITDSSTGARSANCSSLVKRYIWVNNGGLAQTSVEVLDTANNIVSTSKYEPGVLIYGATMVSGDVHHNLVKVVPSVAGAAPITYVVATTFGRASYPVAVPKGTYSGCYSFELNFVTPSRVIRCPGVGVLAIFNGAPGVTPKAWVRVS